MMMTVNVVREEGGGGRERGRKKTSKTHNKQHTDFS